MPPDEVLAAARLTLLAEVGWRGPDGTWRATVLVPLTAGGDLTFALPYAQRATAEAMGEAGAIVVVCSDERLTAPGWRAVAAAGPVDVEQDRSGDRFRADLLDEELRKHPPARLLADSLLQQRENWWYLPRLLVRLRRIDAAWPVAPRDGAAAGVLFGSSAQQATTVAVDAGDAGDAERLVLRPLDGDALPPPGAATLLRHDWSPDLEQRSQLAQGGRLDGSDGTFVVEDSAGQLELPAPSGLLERYRASRAFERACRRALTGRR